MSMPKDTHHLQDATSLINLPLNKITELPSNSDVLAVPIAVAGASTGQWARRMLSTVTLAEPIKGSSGGAWNWMTGPLWDDFQETLKGTGSVNSCVPERMFQYPHSEGDVVSIVDAELLNVVYRVGKKWLPDPPPKLEWQIEVMSEAYAKAETPQGLGGVRVDKVFVTSARWPDTMVTRRMQAERRIQGDDVKSRYVYVPRGRLWDADSVPSNTPTQIGRLKGLVAVEIKNYGVLDGAHSNMEALAHDSSPLGDPTTTVTQARGVRAVLQQALRYAYHYGIQYIFVTDHKTGILLNVPDLPAAGSSENKGKAMGIVNIPQADVRIPWAVVGREHARLGLAYLLFCSCQELDTLAKASSPKSKGKPKAK